MSKVIVEGTIEELVARNGLKNYGCSFVIDLWPQEITERKSISFETGTDDFDAYQAAYLSVELEDRTIPAILIRYKGYPDKTTSADVPLEELDNKELREALQSYLELKAPEISWVNNYQSKI